MTRMQLLHTLIFHMSKPTKRLKLYSKKHLFCHYCLQMSFVYKTVSQISFSLFCLGDKRLLSEFRKWDFRKWDWFLWHNERFSQISWLKIKISKKLRNGFADESNDYGDISIFLLLENPCTFLFAKEKT